MTGSSLGIIIIVALLMMIFFQIVLLSKRQSERHEGRLAMLRSMKNPAER